MTKQLLHRLTARAATTLSTPGRHADGGGLYLLVRQRGETVERLWLFRHQRGQRGASREATISLGVARDVSVARARELAARCRAALAAGHDPRQALARVRGAPTFSQVADQYLEAMAPSLSPKTIASWRLTLGDAYCRALRRMPVNRIGTEDLLAVLKPVWTAKPETAQRVRERVEKVLDSATVAGLRGGANPALWRGHLEHLLAKPSRLKRGHHAAVPWADMPAFMGQLRGLQSVSALALEFAILTAARTGEVLGATWPEIDLERALWIVPAERMKGQREHRVPLGDRAVEVLELVRRIGGAYVFPGQGAPGLPARPLSSMALAMCLRGLRPGVTVHGFRSSFRDWAGEATSFASDLAEAALAHVAGSVERAYRRGDALERRRELMASWERFCDPVVVKVDNVTPMRRGH